jgi:hypothetical protein
VKNAEYGQILRVSGRHKHPRLQGSVRNGGKACGSALLLQPVKPRDPLAASPCSQLALPSPSTSRATVDTTVQPKAVTHPTDSKLIRRGVEIPGRNVLAGAAGDAITLVLAAAGHNGRLLRAWLVGRLAFLHGPFAISATAPPLPSPQFARR